MSTDAQNAYLANNFGVDPDKLSGAASGSLGDSGTSAPDPTPSPAQAAPDPASPAPAQASGSPADEPTPAPDPAPSPAPAAPEPASPAPDPAPSPAPAAPDPASPAPDPAPSPAPAAPDPASTAPDPAPSPAPAAPDPASPAPDPAPSPAPDAPDPASPAPAQDSTPAQTQASVVTGALASGDTDIYFDLDSSVLTSSATASLDAYAQAYLAAGASDPIEIDGFASLDGDLTHNQGLAKDRQNSVAAYLTSKGISKDKLDTGKLGVATDDFDKNDPRPNRVAKILRPNPPPATPDPVPVVKSNPDELYQRGYQMGLNGEQQYCPDTDADGTDAYNRGYGQGVKDRPKARIHDRILNDLTDPASLKEDIDDLSGMDMNTILDVMDSLKKDGKLPDFREKIPQTQHRVGVAMLTVAGDWGDPWKDEIPNLTKPDRIAVLKRVPAGIYTGPGKDDADPDDPPSVQTDDITKLETVATVSVLESPFKHKLFDLKFEVHVGTGGKLTSFEQDLTLFEKKLKGHLSNIPFEVTAAVEFDTAIKFNTDQQQQVTIDKVEANLKSSLEVSAKGVKFRLEIKSDGNGVTLEPVLEIPFGGPDKPK